MKLCNKCGKQLNDNSSFCDSCGNNLTNCNDLIFEYNDKKINLTNIIKMYDAKSAAKLISEELHIPKILSKKIIKSAKKGKIKYVDSSIVKKYKIINGILKWGFLSILAWFILSIIFANNSKKEPSESVKTDINTNVKSDVKDEVLNVDARKLIEDYEANTINANSKYQDKKIKLSGIIKNIDTTLWTDKPIISLRPSGENIIETIYVTFKGDQINKIRKLVKGQKITVIGRCKSGDEYSVNLEDSVLV